MTTTTTKPSAEVIRKIRRNARLAAIADRKMFEGCILEFMLDSKPRTETDIVDRVNAIVADRGLWFSLLADDSIIEAAIRQLVTDGLLETEDADLPVYWAPAD